MNILTPMIQITLSDNEITMNSIEHHLSDSSTSVENLDVKS